MATIQFSVSLLLFLLLHFSIVQPERSWLVAVIGLKTLVLIFGGILLIIGFSTLLLVFLAIVLVLILLFFIPGLIALLGRLEFPNWTKDLLDWLEVRQRRRELVEATNESDRDWTKEEADGELRDLRRKAKRRLERGEIIFGLLLTATFVLAGLYPSIFGIVNNIAPEWQVEILIGVITLTVLLQTVVIEVVTYSGVDTVETEDYDTAIGWQQGIAENVHRLLFAPLILAFAVINKPISENIRNYALDFLEEENVEESSSIRLVGKVAIQWLTRD